MFMYVLQICKIGWNAECLLNACLRNGVIFLGLLHLITPVHSTIIFNYSSKPSSIYSSKIFISMRDVWLLLVHQYCMCYGEILAFVVQRGRLVLTARMRCSAVLMVSMVVKQPQHVFLQKRFSPLLSGPLSTLVQIASNRQWLTWRYCSSTGPGISISLYCRPEVTFQYCWTAFTNYTIPAQHSAVCGSNFIAQISIAAAEQMANIKKTLVYCIHHLQ